MTIGKRVWSFQHRQPTHEDCEETEEGEEATRQPSHQTNFEDREAEEKGEETQ